MYALFCGDCVHPHRMVAAFPADRRVIATDQWPTFEAAARTAACLIVAVPWLHDWPAAGRSSVAVASAAARRPLVVVTSKDADNARLLRGIPADEVVWLSDVERDLWRAVRAAESRGLLRRVAEGVERCPALPLILQVSLAHACRKETPVRSVSELAQAVGRDRRTLWRLWRAAFAGHPPLRLEDFLHWLLVLHATSRKNAAQPWSSVACVLGVHEHTIARAALRLVGTSLRELSVLGEPLVAGRFERDVVAPLLGADAWPTPAVPTVR